MCTCVLRESNPNAVNVQPTGKPVKGSSLLRSYSAPMPQSPSLEVANQDNDQEQIVVPQSEKINIFRTTSDEVDEELEDMWTLKRANPVFDEDDDDFEVSPSKRARTFTYFDAVPESRDDELSEPQLISWSSRVNEDKYGFNLGN
mmetsp:Transcript_16787/g.24827  ORF Transcript_16787/g.24827 Transcript_16787/m.24827 type:complete len:145 (+) Transcript_16787:270-704(+)